MKVLITTLALFVASAAFGLDANSSWSEIRRNMHTLIDVPTLPGGVFNLCADGAGNFKTLKEVYVCTRYAENDPTDEANTGEIICEESVRKHLNYPRLITKNVCVDYVFPDSDYEDAYCAKWEIQDIVRPLTYNMDVHIEENSVLSYVYAFTKSYTIPSCK